MSKIVFLNAGSFKKPVDVYLITNCVDDAHLYTSKVKLDAAIKKYPDYTVYEWRQLRYTEGWYGDTFISWDRPTKRVENKLEFDDTETPWKMLMVAEDKDQWHTNRKFGSVRFAMDEYANKEYCNVCGYDIQLEKDTDDQNLWFRGFAGAEITDRTWLEEYKNKLHPNDDWTKVNLETYVRWIGVIDFDERCNVIDEALKAKVVGYLD